MIRPRAGGFEYSEAEHTQMLMEIASLTNKKRNVQGFVFGALDLNQKLDREVLSTLIAESGSSDKILHRAFDLCIDLDEALEMAIDLGFTRILTSGGQPNVGDGFDKICKLHDKVAGRIEIMPGGGLAPEHITAFLKATGISSYHCSASCIHMEADYISRLRISPTRNVTCLEAIKSYQEVMA